MNYSETVNEQSFQILFELIQFNGSSTVLEKNCANTFKINAWIFNAKD
jgi:hypothetical protein